MGFVCALCVFLMPAVLFADSEDLMTPPASLFRLWGFTRMVSRGFELHIPALNSPLQPPSDVACGSDCTRRGHDGRGAEGRGRVIPAESGHKSLFSVTRESSVYARSLTLTPCTFVRSFSYSISCFPSYIVFSSFILSFCTFIVFSLLLSSSHSVFLAITLLVFRSFIPSF